MQLHHQTPLFICLTRGMLALLVIWLACKGSHASSLVTTDPTTYYEQSLIHRADSASTKGAEKEVQNVTQPSILIDHGVTESHFSPRSNHTASSLPTEPVVSTVVDTMADNVEPPNTEAIPLLPYGNTSTESNSDVVECLDGRNCTDGLGTSNSEHRLAQPTVSLIETAAGFNVGIIAGISALVVVIAALMGVVSFLIYRHFSWNRPQTLSDKFSNDESNGYIDDTVFRENSEEMYSLDNDSFLNSLEAMTIQNYWTDHVKHTKL